MKREYSKTPNGALERWSVFVHALSGVGVARVHFFS